MSLSFSITPHKTLPFLHTWSNDSSHTHAWTSFLPLPSDASRFHLAFDALRHASTATLRLLSRHGKPLRHPVLTALHRQFSTPLFPDDLANTSLPDPAQARWTLLRRLQALTPQIVFSDTPGSSSDSYSRPPTIDPLHYLLLASPQTLTEGLQSWRQALVQRSSRTLAPVSVDPASSSLPSVFSPSASLLSADTFRPLQRLYAALHSQQVFSSDPSQSQPSALNKLASPDHPFDPTDPQWILSTWIAQAPIEDHDVPIWAAWGHHLDRILIEDLKTTVLTNRCTHLIQAQDRHHNPRRSQAFLPHHLHLTSPLESWMRSVGQPFMAPSRDALFQTAVTELLSEWQTHYTSGEWSPFQWQTHMGALFSVLLQDHTPTPMIQTALSSLCDVWNTHRRPDCPFTREVYPLDHYHALSETTLIRWMRHHHTATPISQRSALEQDWSSWLLSLHKPHPVLGHALLAFSITPSTYKDSFTLFPNQGPFHERWHHLPTPSPSMEPSTVHNPVTPPTTMHLTFLEYSLFAPYPAIQSAALKALSSPQATFSPYWHPWQACLATPSHYTWLSTLPQAMCFQVKLDPSLFFPPLQAAIERVTLLQSLHTHPLPNITPPLPSKRL